MWQEKYNENISNIDIKKKLADINISIIKYAIYETNVNYNSFLKGKTDKHISKKFSIKSI